MTDTQKLKQKMQESGYRMNYIAKQTGLSYQGMRNKIKNTQDFRVGEIEKLCELLKLSDAERTEIFFAKNVDKKSPNLREP